MLERRRAGAAMTLVMNHKGQHGESCYGCKLFSLTFDRGRPKTHASKTGDPWDGNPVKERIEELQAAGRTVSAMELHNPDSL